ncbi:uncharacterized protein LOC120648270 [Panicum virgatum]|uniref:uncharacterized protein LOC120648270 n=1 Tax=Panicum virgatum TaxID=38727 RepID=UPI0019D66DFA|nr:uncharacterized protein LOC120648270 [Panicum virgatum]
MDIDDVLAEVLQLAPRAAQPGRVAQRCPPDASRLDARFGWREEYLAFDPTVSPHYQVLLIHTYLDDPALEGSQSEWPPSPYTIPVYSSRTGAWEARPFVREGAAAGTVAGVRSAKEPPYRHALCRHEALYLHCKGDFVMRIALSDNKYQVIKLPAGIDASVFDEMYLGKSEKGVYCAVVENEDYRLLVLFLDESGGRMEWVFKYDINLAPLVVNLSRNHNRRIDRPWTLQDGNRHIDHGQGVKVPEDLQWDSDDDNVLDIEDTGEKFRYDYIFFVWVSPL